MKSSVLVDHKPPARKVLVDLDDLVVVLDRQKKEIRWEFPPSRASHWSRGIATELAKALALACVKTSPGRIAWFKRSGCHMTVVEVCVGPLIRVQTLGRFPSPLYLLLPQEAADVAEAMVVGLQELGGAR